MSQTNISNILLYLKKLFTDGHISHPKDSVETMAKALSEDEHLTDAFIKELLSRRLVIESAPVDSESMKSVSKSKPPFPKNKPKKSINVKAMDKCMVFCSDFKISPMILHLYII